MGSVDWLTGELEERPQASGTVVYTRHSRKTINQPYGFDLHADCRKAIAGGRNVKRKRDG